MSEILVNTIKKADGSGGLTVPAESGTLLSSTDGKVESAFTSQISGRRNMILNGAMQVWQRSESATVSSDHHVAADRWKGRTYGGSGRYTMALDTSDVPSGQSFTNAMKLTVTTADSSNTYSYAIQQNPEGYVFAPVRAGTSDAQQFTISFWAKSSVAGTYCWSARGPSGAASYVFEYTLAANTWTKVTHTVAAPTTTTPTWNYTTSQGVLIEWNLGRQPSQTTSTTEAWHNGNYVATANQTDWIANSGATFHLTGIQLEVGSVATPFEHRSYGEELAACQRYLQKLNGGYMAGNGVGSSNINFGAPLTVSLRAQPTIPNTGYYTHRSGNVNHSANTVIVTSYGTGSNIISLRQTGASVSDEVAYVITITNTLYLDAEI